MLSHSLDDCRDPIPRERFSPSPDNVDNAAKKSVMKTDA